MNHDELHFHAPTMTCTCLCSACRRPDIVRVGIYHCTCIQCPCVKVGGSDVLPIYIQTVMPDVDRGIVDITFPGMGRR